jgi:aromatic-amino-acid transaminase
MFETLAAPQPDKILRIMQEFADDPRPGKIDLGVGVYRTAEGTTPVMRAVREAERRVWETEQTKSYVALAGAPAFRAALADLVLGPALAGGDRLAAAATPGGTGAVRQALELVRRARPEATVWVSDPSWPNHTAILDTMGMRWRPYRYHDAATGGLDRDGMLADLGTVAAGDVILLHGCCHNPTGADLTLADWQAVAAICADRGAVPMVDLAYLGLGDGVEADAAGLRLLAAAVPEMLLAVSGSKSFGLYRDRVGAVLALTATPAAQAAVQGTLAWLNRQAFAFPPDHGARVVTTLLADPALRADWEDELAQMRARIAAMRMALTSALRDLTGSDRFGFLAAHKGMFSLSGADPAQVARLRLEHAIYMIGDGRINLAGLTPATVAPVAQGFAAVLA